MLSYAEIRWLNSFLRQVLKAWHIAAKDSVRSKIKIKTAIHRWKSRFIQNILLKWRHSTILNVKEQSTQSMHDIDEKINEQNRLKLKYDAEIASTNATSTIFRKDLQQYQCDIEVLQKQVEARKF